MSKISSLKGVRTAVIVPKYKFVAFNQAAPVQNTWYTVCELNNILLHERWTWVLTIANEDIEIETTLENGTPAVGAKGNAVFNTSYFGKFLQNYLTGYYPFIDTTEGDWQIGLPLRYFKMRIRKTSNNGSGTFYVMVPYNQC